jgi:Cyclin, N-terminal domain/Cyclin, C-terminal domain
MNIAIVTPTTSEHLNWSDQGLNTDFDVFTQVNFALIQDQIGTMFSQEKSCCVHHNTTIDDASKQGLKFLPKEDWRTRICEWSYVVVDYFLMDRNIVAISLNILDRYLYSQQASIQIHVEQHTFLLAAVSALYLTMKVHTMDNGTTTTRGRRRIKLSSMVEFCRGKLTADDICSMERQILVTLSWNVNSITTSNFVEYFLRLMPTHAKVSVDCQSIYQLSLFALLELSRYIAELAVWDIMISRTYLPSKIAMACIFLSMDEFNFTAFPWTVRNEFQSTLMRVYSNSKSGSTPWNNDDDIEVHRLMEALSLSIWPKISINEIGCDHPLDLARKYGLLKPRCLNEQSSLRNGQPLRRQPLHEEDDWIFVDDVNLVDDLSEDSRKIVSP